MAFDRNSFSNLTPAEKLQLIEDLWDDLARNHENIPIHEWQIEELARRKVNLHADGPSDLSWDEIKRRVRSRHGR